MSSSEVGPGTAQVAPTQDIGLEEQPHVVAVLSRFSQKIFSLGLYELFRWVYVRCERRDYVAR